MTHNLRVFRELNGCIANDPAVLFIDSDIRFLTYVTEECDFVIHAATDVALSNSPIDTFDVYLLGAHLVLNFAIESKA